MGIGTYRHRVTLVQPSAPPVGATDYPSVVLGDGATSYWPLDDPAGSATVRDAAGAWPGEPQGSVAFGVPGPGAGGATAAQFIADNFDATIALPLTTVPRAFTLEAWILTGGSSLNQPQCIFTNIFSVDVPVVFSVRSPGNVLGTVGATTLLGTKVVTDNHWHHVALVVDALGALGAGAFLALYVDGVEDGRNTVTRASASTGAAASIGGNDDVASDFWDGALADVALYPGPLTATALAHHYAQQLTPPTLPVVWDCSLQSAAAQVVDGLAAFFVRGRFHPGITLETQILFEGRTFQVQSLTDVDERHVELQLMCVEVVGRHG